VPGDAERKLFGARAPPAVKKVKARRDKAPRLPLSRGGVRRRVGWGGGERMTYTVSIAGVSGGRVAMAVGKRQRRGSSLNIRALGEAVPLIASFHRMWEELITRVDLSSLLPISSSSNREVGQKKRRVKTSFGQPLMHNGRQVKQDIVLNQKKLQRHRRMRRPCFDPLTALYALRSVPLKPGARMELEILAGMALWRVSLRVNKDPERIYTARGPRQAIRVDGVGHRIYDNGRLMPKKVPRKVSLWFSTDPSRIPFRMQGETKLGLLQADLSTHHPGRSRLKVRVALLR